LATSKRPKEIKPLAKKKLWVRPLLYGHPGAGKTPLAGSTAMLGRTLILNADGPDALESIRKADYWKEYGKNVEFWDVDNGKDLTNVHDYFRRGGGTEEFDWVWLDSATLFEDSDMDDIMRQLHKKNKNRDIHLPDKPQYMLRQNHIGLWVRDMKRLRINFGMTAHVMTIGFETEDEDDDESAVAYMPSIQGGQGKLSSKICGSFGIVGRLHVRRIKIKKKGGGTRPGAVRVLQVQPSEKWYAKDRLSGDRLGTEVVGRRIYMSDIIDAINTTRRK
jgi:hypothetical protein